MIICFADDAHGKSYLKNKSANHVSWVYYHGELEDYFGIDFVSTQFELPLGKYPVIAFRSTAEATAFIWMSNDEYPHLHGLIVFNYDKKAYEYAEKCYNERENNL